MKKIFLLMALFVYSSAVSFAQRPGDLDSSFGTKGIIRTDFGVSANIYGAYGRQVLTRDDGFFYLLFTTNEQTVITRFFAKGTIDRSYGNNGYAPVIGNHVIMQKDGKIVAAAKNHIARYKTNGGLDNTFNKHGSITSGIEEITSIALQNDGKIIAAGINALARYNPDGSADSSLKGNVVTGDYPSIALQGDGKIVVFGTFYPFNDPGNFDGDYRSYAILSRFNSNGSIDAAFGKNGRSDSVGSYSIANAVAIQHNGKIVVVDNNTPAVARYNSNGRVDSSFSNDGIAYPNLYLEGEDQPLAIGDDGKILVTGVATANGNQGEDFAVVRYKADGTPDSTFSSDGIQTTDIKVYDFVSGIALQKDGKIIVAGSSSGNDYNADFSIVRYNTHGSLDSTFSNDGKYFNYLHAGYANYNTIALQKNGKIVVAGTADTGSGKDFAVARYNTDGTADTTFSGNGRQTTHFKNGDEAHSLFIQNDGKIVVTGLSNITNTFPQQVTSSLIRYKSDGNMDTSFSLSAKLPTDFAFGNIGQTVAAESNGKIVAALSGGAFYSPVYLLARYNYNGTLDSSFSTDGFRKSNFKTNFQDAQCIAIQPDGKILVAGSAGTYPDFNFAIARYNEDGSNDTTFSKDGKQTTDFGFDNIARAQSIAIQKDGKIVLAGSVGNYPNYKFAVARYNNDGTIDTTFSGDGKVITAFEASDGATSVVIQKDGRIVAGGNSNGNFALARYNSNGTLDYSFGNLGKKITGVGAGNDGINDMVISGNKLYAAGFSQNPGNAGVIARYFLRVPPTVMLTAPANNATYFSGSSVYLKAVATDADGTISKVEFYNGTTRLFTATDTPYSFKWEHVQKGNFPLSAKAFDNDGLVASSDTIHISVVPEAPPIITITSPTNGQIFTTPASINLKASVQDTDGRIVQVSFYKNADLLTDAEHKLSYTYQWQNVPAATYTITAVARDNWGATTTSAPITITVASPKQPLISARQFLENSKPGVTAEVSLRLSPNPVRDILSISATGLSPNKQTTLSVMSASGIIMKTMRTGNNKTITFNTSSLPPGVYTIKLLNDTRIIYKQFVKI